MKRGGSLPRYTGLSRKTPLRSKGKSDSSLIKEGIQDIARAIVIIRDGGCVLRGKFGHVCGGYTNAGELILQADHLIERSNSSTYADVRLIVCVCKGLHGWKHFKKSNHDQYDKWIKQVIEPERIALWEACERDAHKAHRYFTSDWKKELAYLKTKLRAMEPAHPLAA